MKDYEKEIYQSQLDSEKAVLKALEKNYDDALSEIETRILLLQGRDDADMQHVIYQIDYQRSLKKQVEGILETLHSKEFETVSEYLTESYHDGFLGVLYELQKQGVPLAMPINQAQVVEAIQHETQLTSSLYVEMGKDITKLQKEIASEISRGISNGAMVKEMARNISNYSKIPLNRSMTIARTESHRIRETAASNSREQAKIRGADVVKIWDSALDGKTRDSHREMDGQIREVDEYFNSPNGGKALEPGGFGDPAEDINCRCRARSEARWALDSDETKILGDTSKMTDEQLEPIAKKLNMTPDELRQYSGQIIPVKAKDFDDFKRQYDKIWKYEGSDLQKEAEARIAGYKTGKSESVRQSAQKISEKYANLSYAEKDELIFNNQKEIDKLNSQKKAEEMNLLLSSDVSEMEKFQKNALSIQNDIDKLKKENEDIQKNLGLPTNAKERFIAQLTDISALPHDIKESEQGVISSWTRTDYVFINDYMRTGNKGVRAESIENAKALQSMIDRNVVQESFTVKRGSDYNALNHLFGNDTWKNEDYNVNGKIIQDNGFMATTPLKGGGFAGEIQMYIDVPKGAKGVYIGDESAAPDEKEFLLQAGTKHCVDRIETWEDKWKEKHYDIYMRVIVDE